MERRVLSMHEEGRQPTEIGRRFGKSPAQVERILQWVEIPRHRPAPRRDAEAFESRILALRSQGESYERIGERFDRSGEFIARVERMAHLRPRRDRS